MRAVVQRVESCRIVVSGEECASIGQGLLVYLGIATDDDRVAADYLISKIVGLRIFDDDAGLMNLSAEAVGAEICLVSQFTLYGDTKKGRRPSFSRAAKPKTAVPLYEYCVCELRRLGFRTQTGVFGANMKVDYINNGPVTILIDSERTI